MAVPVPAMACSHWESSPVTVLEIWQVRFLIETNGTRQKNSLRHVQIGLRILLRKGTTGSLRRNISVPEISREACRFRTKAVGIWTFWSCLGQNEDKFGVMIEWLMEESIRLCLVTETG